MANHVSSHPTGAVFLYQTEDGQARLEVQLEGETVWLSQKQMADLFQKDVRTISEHIRNVFDEGELSEESVIRNLRITAADGKNYQVVHYNLDVIISVGYRVKSHRGNYFDKLLARIRRAENPARPGNRIRADHDR